MKEKVLISLTSSTVNNADFNGFKDVLQDVLHDEGATVEIKTMASSPFAMKGGAVRIVWTASYSFTTPDGKHTFSEQDITAEVVADRLDHSTLMKLMASRARLINKAYRNVLQGILNLSNDIKSGVFVPEMDVTDYLTATLDAALVELPDNL
jgi:hypothetical protein